VHDVLRVELGDAVLGEAEHAAEDLGGVFADGGSPRQICPGVRESLGTTPYTWTGTPA
jgi:hypothetical protein